MRRARPPDTPFALLSLHFLGSTGVADCCRHHVSSCTWTYGRRMPIPGLCRGRTCQIRQTTVVCRAMNHGLPADLGDGMVSRMRPTQKSRRSLTGKGCDLQNSFRQVQFATKFRADLRTRDLRRSVRKWFCPPSPPQRTHSCSFPVFKWVKLSVYHSTRGIAKDQREYT